MRTGRTGILIVRPHSKAVWQIHMGQNVELHEQRAEMDGFLSSRTHEKFAEMQLWESDHGMTRHHDCITPKAAKEAADAEAAAIEKQQKEFDELQKPKQAPAEPPEEVQAPTKKD